MIRARYRFRHAMGDITCHIIADVVVSDYQSLHHDAEWEQALTKVLGVLCGRRDPPDPSVVCHRQLV